MVEPRQHHILPAFYLAGFTDTGTRDGTLRVFDYSRKLRYAAKPEKVARERDFYRIYKPGLDGYAVERDLLARLEGELAPVLRRVSETEKASPADLGGLLSLVAMVYVRGRRGLERAHLGVEEGMRSGLADGTLTPEAWEEVRELHGLAGEYPEMARIGYEEAQRLAREDEAWSPVAPRDYVVARLGELYELVLDGLLPHSREGHIWSMAVASPGAGEFVASDSPLCWMSALPWEPGHKRVGGIEDPDQGERLDDPNTTVTFPLNKRMALITRPLDRGVKDRHFHYEAVAEVVAWVNTRMHLASLGTLYSASEDFGLLRKGNTVGRSADYFAHQEALRHGSGPL